MNDVLSSPGFFIAIVTLITAITNAIISFLTSYKPNKKISDIETKVNEARIANNEEHKIIVERLDKHSSAVEVYLCEKDISIRFANVAKNAIEYINSVSLSICIDRFCSRVAWFLEDISTIGIENLSKEQMLSKLEILRCDILDIQDIYCIGLTEKEHKCLSKIFTFFSNDVIDVFTDNINSKLRRIIIKTEDFAHSIIKEGINIYYKKGEKNDTSK